MGTYLSKPITDKESHDTDNGWLSCGSSSMQGWRESQEVKLWEFNGRLENSGPSANPTLQEGGNSM